MDKTEMTKRYEAETGKDRPTVNIYSLIDWYEAFSAWLESKAAAYDRLMSGTGKMSMQEWANFLGAPVTLDRDGKVKAHYSSPVRYSEEEGWWYNPHNQRFEIPRHLVDTHGCWPRLSITYPDGWEEK